MKKFFALVSQMGILSSFVTMYKRTDITRKIFLADVSQTGALVRYSE